MEKKIIAKNIENKLHCMCKNIDDLLNLIEPYKKIGTDIEEKVLADSKNIYEVLTKIPLIHNDNRMKQFEEEISGIGPCSILMPCIGYISKNCLTLKRMEKRITCDKTIPSPVKFSKEIFELIGHIDILFNYISDKNKVDIAYKIKSDALYVCSLLTMEFGQRKVD